MSNQAFNPFLPLDVYIPDGEPHVFGDRIYIFGSHDKEGGDTYCALDYEFYSAPIDDLSSWSSKGINYRATQDKLYSKDRPYMFAPDVVKGNDGRFYLYYGLSGYKGSGGYHGPISVAVCDIPDGKYEYLGYVKNKDGTPFNKYVCFDPAVINDNGVIRLYYGTSMPMGMYLPRPLKIISSPIFKNIYGKSKEEIEDTPSVWGANTVTLCDDMLTVKTDAVRIIPEKTKGTAFEGHGFFEGSSIRKINDIYYFIYSSQKNHELCYATSKYPDRDFVYGGTIISTGDVGINGRKDKDRLNSTGTTHGSIECINGKWYVFYHRLTHGTDYSRQACAEPIIIENNGSIKQVEVTSCGLNGKPLKAAGKYPSVIACNITNGKMPHISNQKCKKPIPMVTHRDNERFITNIDSKSTVTYKWFDFTKAVGKISLDIGSKSQGEISIFADDELISKIAVDGFGRKAVGAEYKINDIGKKALTFKYNGEQSVDLYSFEFN
ncbi:MAG: family 43 glycosylhydrolase [Eubacterium sp.]